jgi:hypothetical protein
VLTPIDLGTETAQVDSIVQSVRRQLAADVDVTVIAAEVEAELAAYSTASVTRFVPILVERSVLERLRRHRSE